MPRQFISKMADHQSTQQDCDMLGPAVGAFVKYADNFQQTTCTLYSLAPVTAEWSGLQRSVHLTCNSGVAPSVIEYSQHSKTGIVGSSAIVIFLNM